MVTVAFAAAAPSLGLAGAGASAIGLAIGAGVTVLASYADQQLVLPALFGKKNPKPDAIEGFQMSTTDPGAPRWEVFGSRAWVPCHYLWSMNVREELSQTGQQGKGAPRPFVQTVRADVGLAACDGPIADFITLFADERPFLASEFNPVVLEDYRWIIAAGTGPNAGRLVIACESVDQQAFSTLFQVGDMVRPENVTPSSLNSFWRVHQVTNHAGTTPSMLILDPLEGQTPVAGTAGVPVDPGRLRRIDQGGYSRWWDCGSNGTRVTAEIYGTYATVPNAESQADYDRYFGTSQRRSRWVIGGIYRVSGWAGTQALLRLESIRVSLADPSVPAPDTGTLEFRIVAGGVGANNSVPSDPPIILHRTSDIFGFAFVDAEQEVTKHLGAMDEVQDSTLAALEPDAPAHRGIAHVSLGGWNLGPHGNRFPQVTGLVRPRFGESVAVAIKRMCGRTMDDKMTDVSNLRDRNLLGYSRPAGLSNAQVLQPLAAFYGIAMQDRGGVMTFLDERDLPVVPVATRHLNARAPGESPVAHGFIPQRIGDDDVPQRVLIKYIEPTLGENEAEGSGRRAPGSPDAGTRDLLELDFRPLVVWPSDVKRRVRELERRIRLETQSGQLRLPPGYMDVLPATILTFQSNNWEQELADVGTEIAHDTRLRDILPNSVAVMLRFANGQVALLLDDGNGTLGGLPAGITASTNEIDYEAGRIDLVCSVDLDTDELPAITYRYEKQWFMRANKATLAGYDFTVTCDLVTTTTDEPLPPLPRDLPTGLGGAIGGVVPLYRTEVLDMPALYPNGSRAVWIGMAVAPNPGSVWRGAVVYQSPNGVDRWVAVGQVQMASVMGTLVSNNLPTTFSSPTPVNPSVIDWSTEVLIDLPGGETLETVTTEQIGWGQNWALLGDELIAFHEAEAQVGTQWKLRGLIRGMRYTLGAMDTHADGERFVLVSGIGGLHGLYYDPVGGFAAGNRTYHFRVVPGGASIDSVETISTLVKGRSALPAAPIFEPWQVAVNAGSGVAITWGRRSLDQATVFGPSPLQPGEFERFRVVVFDAITMLGLIGTLGAEAAIAAAAVRTWQVGDESMGTPLVTKRVDYRNSEAIDDGFTIGVSLVGVVVYQRGPAGESERSAVEFFVPT